jgi:acetyl-CoA carboxylase biotin carboxylase subunit
MIESMGNKSKARKTMIAAGIPVVPGSDGNVTSIDDAKAIAKAIGYPMIVKATSGGGGKGMRVINHEDELEKNFVMAQKEAKASFDDDAMYMERYIVNPSHIEFQILADEFGNTIHLGERDCSIQRRHQKIMEEAPSTRLTPELRAIMGAVAVRAAKSIGYKNAGTVEFLLEESCEFFFMEINTRIQVEHPITEMITGIDLIKKQIEIAGGLPLNLTQDDIVLRGHSIECRINAENPSKGFRPSPGTIDYLHMPGGNGIRVDSAIYNGYTVPPLYDSMLAKLIVHADTRMEAIRKMNSALGEFVVSGIDTNIDFHMELINQPDFISGDYNTGFIEKVQGIQ